MEGGDRYPVDKVVRGEVRSRPCPDVVTAVEVRP